MDHTQFETQIAAILTAGVAGAAGLKDPVAIVALMTEIRDEMQKRVTITKQSAAFTPKGR